MSRFLRGRFSSQQLLVVVLAIIMCSLLIFLSAAKTGADSSKSDSLQKPDLWQPLKDNDFGIMFEFPASWSKRELVYPLDNYRAIEISDPKLGQIIITKEHYTEKLTPSQWLELNRNKYHKELVTKIGELEIAGNEILVVGQPETCETVPMVVAILSINGEVFIFSHYERASRDQAFELRHLLETLSLEGEQNSINLVNASLLRFPEPPTIDFSCADGQISGSEADEQQTNSINARKCPGASMFIPTEGEMNVPWKCFNDDPYCYPYKSRDPNDPECGQYNYYCNPHPGIDIFGGHPPGVTPVYTTFSGVTQLVGSSAVRIIFDSPYEGKSAYFSHMASGNQDFREVVNGQKAEAGVTKIGSQGDFGTNAGVHLHLSFDDGNPGSDLWPTLDPTEFFKARYLKYYLGWDHIGSSVTCSEGGKEVDVVLVIDSSGSMVDNDPANHRLAAGKAYLTASLAGDYVGVIDFDDNARVASPLLKLPDNKDTLSAAIDTINSSGGTNIGGGIQAACNELINSDSPNYVKAAILLTDGENDPPKPIDEHQCFIDRGWPLYIFGLGDADDNLLSQIAANTNGEYKRLPPSNFVCEFQAVRTKIGGGQPGPCTAIQIDPNETISIPVNVVQWLLKATFGISWPGSDVEMSLMSPSGRIIDRNTDDADVEHDSGATYETYSITNPEPGEWQVSLFGADVPVGGEEVVFNYATIDNPNPIDKTSNYLPLVLKAYQSGPPQIPTTTPTPPPDTSTPTPTSTPTSTPPQPPSASLSGMNQIDTCAWDVRMTLRNFAPNSQITVHSDYNEVVCDTGKIVSSSWTSGYGSPTDANGNLVVAYLHQGTGDYKYTFTDETGGQATLSFTTDPSPSDQIVFVSSRDGDNEVFIMSIDEANVEQLTNNSATDMNPIWFPNGNKLVFHSNRDGNNQIYTMNSNGSNQSRLLSSSTIDEWPQLSPDGNKIAFSRVADFDGAGLRSEVFVMDSNGSGVTRLTNTSGSNNGFNYGCWASGWSPDSLQILFYCYIDNYDQLLIMNANGNNQHKLTTDTHWNAIPSMSPDGTKIVYSSYRDGNYEIYVMNSNGTNQTRLTNNSVEEWRPTWSQDGSKIIFESKRAGETQIYWMSLDGSQQVRLTSNSAYNGQPNWRPD